MSEKKIKPLRKDKIFFWIITSALLTWGISTVDLAVIAYFSQIHNDQIRGFWTVITNYGHGGAYFSLCFLGLLIGYQWQMQSKFLGRRVFEFSFMSLMSLISAGLVVMWLHYSGQKMYKSLKTRNSHNVIKEIQAISRGIQGILS